MQRAPRFAALLLLGLWLSTYPALSPRADLDGLLGINDLPEPSALPVRTATLLALKSLPEPPPAGDSLTEGHAVPRPDSSLPGLSWGLTGLPKPTGALLGIGDLPLTGGRARLNDLLLAKALADRGAALPNAPATGAADLEALLAVDTPTGEEDTQILYLEVFINDYPRNMIAEFMRTNGDMAIRAGELPALGIVPPAALADADWVKIGDLPGGAYRYDQALQAIYLELSASAMQERTYAFERGRGGGALQATATGGFLNYQINGGYTRQGGEARFTGMSTYLEGWGFHPAGSLLGSLLLESDPTEASHARRLGHLLHPLQR